MKKYQSNGLTLIELLIAMSVLAILLGVAIPSFMSVIRANALTSSSNEFVAAIALTRGEAIKRGATTRLCIIDSNNSCSSGDGTNWADGWVLYADLNNNEELDTGEAVRFFEGIRSNYTLIASDTDINSIGYDRQGRLLTQTAFEMSLCAANAPSSGDATHSRTLSFNSIGRVKPSAGASSCP
ncbi:MAG: GspH/FimT family pseudopilin [Agarilytica sp.]